MDRLGLLSRQIFGVVYVWYVLAVENSDMVL